jgi:tetratricopeptide (TPR) repeat protein
MKRFASVALLISLALVLVLILWPSGFGVPKTLAPNLPPDQDERALHLELGMIYERSRQLEKAQGEYEQAISLQQDEITLAAIDGLKRVLARQQSQWLKLQASARAFLIWIAENGLKLLIVIGAAWLVWRAVSYAPRRPGYLLLPLQDHTGSEMGEALTNAIHTTLQSVRLTHLSAESGVFALSENLSIPSFGTLEDNSAATAELLAAIDSCKVGTIDLPLGQLASAMQRWIHMQKYTLGGNIYQFGSLLWLEFEMQDTKTGTIERLWETKELLPDEADVAERTLALSQHLSYKIVYDLCPQLEASSWHSMQLFTEALKEIQTYQAEQTNLNILQGAASKLENVVRLDPGYLLAKYNLAIAYTNLGQYRQAVNWLKEVKEANGDFKLEATYNLGLAYYHHFQDWAYEKAIEQFQEVLDQVGGKTADGQYTPLIALTHCGLASVYAQQLARVRPESQEFLEKVKKHCDQAVAIAGGDREVRAVAHVALGIAYLKDGASEEAIREFGAAIRLKPSYPITYVYLSDSHLEQGNRDEAVRWLQQAVRFSPRYEYAHYKLGRVYGMQGKTDLAIAAYRQAPHIADAQNELGKLLAGRQQYDEALTAFRSATDLNSRHAEAFSNLAWYTVEAARRDDTSLQEATEAARRALQLEQGTEYEWRSHDVLGWVQYHCGSWEDAERELRISIEKNPAEPQSRFHLALLYRARGEVDKARETIINLFRETKKKGLWRDRAEELMRELNT